MTDEYLKARDEAGAKYEDDCGFACIGHFDAGSDWCRQLYEEKLKAQHARACELEERLTEARVELMSSLSQQKLVIKELETERSRKLAYRKLFRRARDFLRLECDGRCAYQNPCSAKEALEILNNEAKSALAATEGEV